MALAGAAWLSAQTGRTYPPRDHAAIQYSTRPTRDPVARLNERIEKGEVQLAFLVNPTPMWQVQAVAESGETMPQKSTWFHPKIPAGLGLRGIDPRGPP